MASSGVVAAGHPLTAEAAADVLRSGGNAFDAAIAGFFMACVAEPVLASLGGGGFMVAREAAGRIRVFDFFTQTPAARIPVAELDFHPVTVDFGSAQQEFHIGLGACAAPGCVRGAFAVHRCLGKMPMRELVQPAVCAARRGVQINALQAYIFNIVAPIYMTESARPVFAGRRNPDHIAEAGESLSFVHLADTIERLAADGDDLFYRGEIADRVARICAEGGGHLRRCDLAAYRVAVREPLAIRYHRASLFTNPPPSAGGLLIAFGLSLLREADLAKLNTGSYEYLRLLTEVMLQTSAARAESLVGPPAECGQSEPISLLTESYLERYRAGVLNHWRAFRGTTHISVMDGDGNIATTTVSNGEGCGEIVPDTGVMLNNMLGEEDVNPAGFHRWLPNQRMSSMMAPTVAVCDDGRIIATGSGGSNRIRTALLQVLINLIDFGMDVDTAVRQPRVHIEEHVLNIEGGADPAAVDRLTAEFPHHRLFETVNLFFGGAHTVVRESGGASCGAGDPRRGGVCVTLP